MYSMCHMTLDEILHGESKNIEYKVELPKRSKKYLKSVIAFANTQWRQPDHRHNTPEGDSSVNTKNQSVRSSHMLLSQTGFLILFLVFYSSVTALISREDTLSPSRPMVISVSPFSYTRLVSDSFAGSP